jgi:hypothetical protein
MSEIYCPAPGRRFHLSRERVGDALGWVLREWDGERWEFIDGAYTSKLDARDRAREITQEVSR